MKWMMNEGWMVNEAVNVCISALLEQGFLDLPLTNSVKCRKINKT